ncbi:MAG: hypothetical protein QNJ51_21710 [Calothrix sp. MO_167.B12]|nr:hypothetical protein [Calothrix sp. MO_167.B12]
MSSKIDICFANLFSTEATCYVCTVDGSIQVDHRKIKVPKIGWIKTFERLPQGIQPKSFTLSRQGNRWFVSFLLEVEPQHTHKLVDVVGVDLGIEALATLSTGETFSGAKSYRKLERKLSRLQWLNRHKIKAVQP